MPIAMKKQLIYDIGLNEGEDTSYYLSQGFRVIAVDASSELIHAAHVIFAHYIKTKQLILLHVAISDRDNAKANFYLSKRSVWNSMHESIANRSNALIGKIEIKTKKLSSIIKKHGIPYYCKIDIEGNDMLGLHSLRELSTKPKFISVESECTSDGVVLSKKGSLATLDELNALGYKKFKLVDQLTLIVLEPNTPFYTKENILMDSLRNTSWSWGLYYKLFKEAHRRELYKKLRYKFPFGATGPYGDNLESDWLDYKTAKTTLLFHKEHCTKKHISVWCDWHAKLA